MLKNVFETFPTFAVVRFRKARLETEALRHDALNMSVKAILGLLLKHAQHHCVCVCG
jgi:hypothetical protein